MRKETKKSFLKASFGGKEEIRQLYSGRECGLGFCFQMTGGVI